MSVRGLYGSKCHLCAHLDGPTHDVDEVWPVAHDECPRCRFCQSDSFTGALLRASAELVPHLFDPDVRAAVQALRNGKSHPLIDTLRAENQAGGADNG